LALLDHQPGETVELAIARGANKIAQPLALKPSGYGVTEQNVARVAWEQLGVRVVPVPASAVSGINDEYTGGLKITEIRSGSPASKQRLLPGDVIVGIMEWHTSSMDNLQWILSSPNFRTAPSAKYYVIRKRQQMMVALSPESTRNR
jgi:serine protease Do